MYLSQILREVRSRAPGFCRNYDLAIVAVLKKHNLRPTQQWGVTRGLKNDVPGIADPDDLTELQTFVASCLGKEGNAKRSLQKPVHIEIEDPQLMLQI